MARTGFSTAHALRNVQQSTAFFRYAQTNTFFGKFIGPLEKGHPGNDAGEGVTVANSPNSLIQVVMDFTKEKGDKVTFPMMAPLQASGTVGDDDLEGNEEAMSYYDWSLELFAIAHAVRGEGDLSDQRVKFSAETKARQALSDWMGRKTDEYIQCVLSGVGSTDGNIAAVAPSSARRVIGGETAAGVFNTRADLGDLTANELFGPQIIDAAKMKATVQTGSESLVRPIRVDGEDHYVIFIHPWQAFALRQNTAWSTIQQNANVRGAKNPLFTGAIGMWNNVWIHVYGRVETRLGAGGATATELFNTGETALDAGVYAARALFCGAQAGCLAWCRTPKPLYKKFDYDRKWGCGIEAILAAGKPKFNGQDYGVIAVDTAYVPR